MKAPKFILAILFQLTSIIVCGQTGTIKGEVYHHEEKKNMPGVSIHVGKQLKTVTDIKGKFQVDSIPIGTYNLTAEYLLWNQSIDNLKISADTTVAVKLTFPPLCKYDKSEKDKRCPICKKKNEVVPIIYGLPMGPLDEEKYYYAGCEITLCDPNWYCKRDNYKF